MSHFAGLGGGSIGAGSDSTDTSKFSPFDGSDNRKLKTPFYRISIMTSDKKNKIDLPTQLSRLIAKIEVNEVYDVGCFHPLTITVTFIEGSREPFVLNTNSDTNVNSLYSIGGDNKGSLTNLIGMLTDLRFQGDGSSITAAVTEAVETLQANTAQAFQTAANGNSMKDPVEVVNAVKTQSSGNYLFKQGNILKLTWGYLDGLGNEEGRTVAGVMTVVQADYPENDHPTLTITCQPLTSVFDQIAPLTAVPFNTTSTLSIGAPKTFQDMPLPQVAQTIAKMCGIKKTIISQNLLAQTLDSRHIKIWAAGQSLHEFLSELARKSLAYYTILLDKNDEFVFVFMSRVDFEKQVKLNAIGTNLFAYKQPGTILKSVSVKASFDIITTTTFSGTDIEGNNTYYSAQNGGLGQAIYSNHKFAPTNTETDNAQVSVQLSNNLPGNDFSGIVSNKPFADSSTSMSEGASAHAGCTNKVLSLEFTSIGFPLIKAGEPILISNIGERFSTVYRVQEVTHVIDSDGYNCHGNLRSALFAAHANEPSGDIQQGTTPQVEEQMYKPLAAASSSPKDQYDAIAIG